MRSHLPKIIFTIIFSSTLLVSCGNEENNNEQAKKLLDHLVECSEKFESCKALCPPRPTKEQMARYYDISTTLCNGNNPPFDQWDSYECHLYAANAVFGDEDYDIWCNDRCVEEYYACIFGDEWEGLNLKKPEDFKLR